MNVSVFINEKLLTEHPVGLTNYLYDTLKRKKNLKLTFPVYNRDEKFLLKLKKLSNDLLNKGLSGEIKPIQVPNSDGKKISKIIEKFLKMISQYDKIYIITNQNDPILKQVYEKIKKHDDLKNKVELITYLKKFDNSVLFLNVDKLWN